MDDDRAAEETLLNELAEARRCIAELEASESERKRAEEALRRERDLLNRVMETSPAGIVVVDRQGRITFANARAEQVLGLTKDEITRCTYNDPEWRITDYEGNPFPDEELPFQRVMATGQPVYDVRHAIGWPDGRRVLLSINAVPLFGEAGQVSGMVAMVEDVTERVRAEKELQESEDKYRTLVEQSLQGFVIAQGIPPRVLFANPAMTEIVGYTAEELVSLSPGEIWGLLLFADQASLFQRYQDRLEGKPVPSRYELCIKRKDGTPCWVELLISRIEYCGEPALQATFVDVTERKRAEQELQAQRDFAMQVMNAMGQGLTVTDRERRFEFVNPAYAHMLGYLPEELIGKTPYDVTLSEDHAILVQAHARRLEGGTSSYETRLQRADGSIVPVLVTGAPRWREGKIAGAIAVITDLTERKRAEEALRQRTVELQARNEELDAFAHTVAHDLKALLSVMIGYAEVLKDHYAMLPDEELRRYLHAIARDGRKVNNIIDELLLLAEVRKTEVEILPLDMAGIVAEAQQRLAYTIEDLQAEIVLPKTWLVALGYDPWVEEVWVNYLSNALKYGGKPPRVELGATEQPDGLVRFWVRDNGPGVAPEDRFRLFVPFTQLAHVRATGHGLGLSIVRRIVEKLDGQVGVESESGAGSTFWFALPAP